jgi:hypothetical protein
MRRVLWLVLMLLASLNVIAQGPTISGIAVSAVTSNSATIIWTTSAPASSQIFYGIGNTNSFTGLNSGLVTSHSQTLRNLTQGQVYSYYTQSTTTGGTTNSTQETFALCLPAVSNSGMTVVTAGINPGYATGILTATWENDSGVVSPTPALCGSAITTPQTYTVPVLGNISLSLPDNNYVVPSPGHWNFTVSNATGLNANSIISGPVIDLSTLFGLQASPGGSGPGAVSSVFGRTGAVVAAASDYSHVSNLSLGDGDSLILFATGSVGNRDLAIEAVNTLDLGNSAGAVIQLTYPSGDFSFASGSHAGVSSATVGSVTSISMNGEGTGGGISLSDGPSANTLNLGNGGNNAVLQTAGLVVDDSSGSVWGSPTGGAKGSGTINAAGLYVNGTAVGASPVSSVYGRTGAVVAVASDYAAVPSLSLGDTESSMNFNSSTGDVDITASGGASIGSSNGGIDAVLATGSNSVTLTNTTGLDVIDTEGSVWGNATGGSEGSGTINATGLFINGTPVGGSTASCASATGSAVPADGCYSGLNIGGNLRGWTGVNPTGSVYAAQIDLTSMNGVALGSPSNFGTSPGTVPVQGVNAFVTNTPAVTGSGIFEVSPTTSANSATNQFFMRQTSTVDASPSTVNVTAQDTASTSTAVANGGAFITGTPTTNSAASFALAAGYDTCSYQVNGTWTGTLTVEGSFDGGTTWISAGIHQQGTSYVVNGFTANFAGENNCGTYTNVRVRATAAWTGTATVRASQSINTRIVYLANPINLKDGTTQSTVNTIKAASTAAASTDTSIVVQLSPVQPNLTAPLNVALAANQSVNQAQVGGTAVVADPCQSNVKSYGSSSMTASTQIITGTAAKHTYICSWNDMNGGTAQNYTVVEGTGTVCATSTAAVGGMSGGTTAATGWNMAANQGRTFGAGGFAVGEAANATGDNVCVLISGSSELNVGFSYVQQ